jgi:hypothetical protein
MTDIILETGQTARIEAGIVQVQKRVPVPHHYRLTAQHKGGGLLDVRCSEYDAAVAFLKQLERLGYTMRGLSRVERG